MARGGWTRLLIVLSLVSCSDGGGGPGGSGGGGGGGAGPAGSGGAAGGAAGTGTTGTGGSGPPQDCTQFANPAPMIEQTLSSDPAPTPAGGEIQTGTYYLTSYTYHQMTGPCEPRSVRWTLFVDATSTTEGTSREVETDVALNASYWDRYTYTTRDTLQMLDRPPTCPTGVPDLRSYTATPTTLTYVGVPSGPCGRGVRVYTRQ